MSASTVCIHGSSVARAAPRHARQQLPFGVWMALAKATPVAGLNEDEQGMLGDAEAPGDSLPSG